MQKEIERAEIRQLKSLDVSVADSLEMLLHTRRGNLAHEQWIELLAQGDQSDVGCVAFVAGTRVRQFCKPYFQFCGPLINSQAIPRAR